MFELLSQNLQLIGILILTYLGSLGVNTLLGIYNNLNNLKEEFSKEKLFHGLLRGGIILVGGLVITVVISLLPGLLNQFGISSSTDLFENISVVAMAGVLVSTIIRYLGDALKKFYAILNLYAGEDIEEDESDEGETE